MEVWNPRVSVVSSNRTRCPTMVPGVQFSSVETREASVMAATRRGCVTQMDLAIFFVWLLLLYDGGEGGDGVEVDDFAAALADALSMPLSEM